MSPRNLLYGLTVLLLTAPFGCQPQEHIQANAPPQGDAQKHPRIAEYYAYQHDQALLANRSIADIHFVPYTAELSGTGIARLERYGELLAEHGGTLHYDTDLRDRQLLANRLAAVNEFMVNLGQDDIRVESGMTGGPGMESNEAIGAAGVAQQPEPRSWAYRHKKGS